MKKRYIIPEIILEELEVDGVMNGHPSQWTIKVSNAAPDDDDDHSKGLEGSDNTDPTEPPMFGD